MVFRSLCSYAVSSFGEMSKRNVDTAYKRRLGFPLYSCSGARAEQGVWQEFDQLLSLLRSLMPAKSESSDHHFLNSAFGPHLKLPPVVAMDLSVGTHIFCPDLCLNSSINNILIIKFFGGIPRYTQSGLNLQLLAGCALQFRIIGVFLKGWRTCFEFFHYAMKNSLLT